MNSLSEKDSSSALENRFPYIFTKASHFIKEGHELYSEKDAFNFPDGSFSKQDIELIEIGCKQLIKGIGLSLENPLRKIGVRGCHKLFQLFHFEIRYYNKKNILGDYS